MKQRRLIMNMFSVVVLCLFSSSLAQAQATRTWVSGVGDDLNPCSRTAPCKTFAGAISKTAEGGEISVLDPGGYGAVTITKSITIDGGTGAGWGSILASGTNGVIVNVTTNPTTAVVTLRNLSINGIKNCVTGGCAGLNGIRYLAGSKLIIENCTIFGFAQKGIDVNLATSGSLAVKDTTIENVADGVVMTNSAGTMTGSLEQVKIHGASNSGLNLLSGAATISSSEVSKNTNFGVIAQGGSTINIVNTDLLFNGTAVSTNNAAATIRLIGNRILNNATSITITAGTVASDGENRVAGNPAGVAPNGVVTKQ